MHFADVRSSKRLSRLLDLLSGGESLTTAQIQSQTDSMAPATDIGELRRNGFDIKRSYRGRTEDGHQINEYQLWGCTRRDALELLPETSPARVMSI